MKRNRLKDIRIQMGLTQQEVAEKIGVTRTSYTHYENGERWPTNETLSALADFFDVSVDYILGRTDIKKYNDEILAFNSTENLTDEDLIMVRSLIENLKKKNSEKK